MSLISNPKPGDDVSVRQAIARLGSSKLGPTSTPTFLGVTTTSLTITGLTDNALIYPVSGLLTSLGVATNGQIPVGSTGAVPVLTTITGTANQVVSTPGAGSITLSTPQDIHTGAIPTFAGQILNGTTPIGLDMSGGTFSSATQNWPADPVIQSSGSNFIRSDATNFNLFFGVDTASGLPGGITQAQNDGEDNLFLGYQAGYNNDRSGGGVDGRRNVYIGFNSGKGSAASAGFENVGIGSQTFEDITSGQGNVAIGKAALANLTTGAGNFAMGVQAGNALVAGGGNIFIGSSAGKVALGSNSLGIGSSALLAETGSGANIAIGSLTGSGITSSRFNTYIGNSAGRRNQTGNENIGIGYLSAGGRGGSVNSHAHNTIVGSYAGGFITTGGDNTLIGFGAARNLTTGTFNIFIGNLAGFNQTGADDLLIIDGRDRGSTAAELTDSLIYGSINSIPASQFLRFNVGTTTWGNATHSDADGSRSSIFDFKGQQSGGEETTLARIEISHDGAADDQKGKVVISTNDGSDGDTPTDHVKVDAAGNTYIGDGGATNFSKFEADGTYVMKGAATIWNDLVLPLSSARVPASNAPAWVSFIGNLNNYTYGLNDFQEFSTELDHGYKSGSAFEFHIHGALNGSNVDERTIKFEIEYTIADAPAESGFGDIYPATTTVTGELIIPAATADLTAFSVDIGTDSTGSFVQGAIINGRIRRIASTGTEPTGDPFLTEVGVHTEDDTIGTRTETTK